MIFQIVKSKIGFAPIAIFGIIACFALLGRGGYVLYKQAGKSGLAQKTEQQQIEQTAPQLQINQEKSAGIVEDRKNELETIPFKIIKPTAGEILEGGDNYLEVRWEPPIQVKKVEFIKLDDATKNKWELDKISVAYNTKNGVANFILGGADDLGFIKITLIDGSIKISDGAFIWIGNKNFLKEAQKTCLMKYLKNLKLDYNTLIPTPNNSVGFFNCLK